MISARVLGVTLLLVAATSCGGGDSTGSASPVATAPATETPPTTTASAATVESTPANGGSNSAGCTDPSGDGGANDITAVTLRMADGILHTGWTFARPPATAGTALWQVTAASLDGQQVLLFGVKYMAGRQTAHYVFTDRQDNLADQATLSGRTLLVDFPASYAETLGTSWHWKADSTVNGKDADSCPDPGDDVLNPQYAMFPAG